MTTAKPKPRPVAQQQWEPYPELPREYRDMMQTSPIAYLMGMFLSILTPGLFYYEHPSIIIGDQIPIYYGPPRAGRSPDHVIPDCLVALDVDVHAIWARVGYDPIQNGKPPDFVVEVASRSTYRNDSEGKRETYRQIGVPEYWRLDPTGGQLYGQSVIGERLVNGRYEALPLLQYDDGGEGSTSPILNLNIRWRGERFRVHHPLTGEEYEHPQVAIARQQNEIARLQAENRRLRGEG